MNEGNSTSLPGLFRTTDDYYSFRRLFVAPSGAPTGTAYPWSLRYQNAAGVWSDDPSGIAGTATDNPLYMADGSTTVATGTPCEAVQYTGGYLVGWPIAAAAPSRTQQIAQVVSDIAGVVGSSPTSTAMSSGTVTLCDIAGGTSLINVLTGQTKTVFNPLTWTVTANSLVVIDQDVQTSNWYIVRPLRPQLTYAVTIFNAGTSSWVLPKNCYRFEVEMAGAGGSAAFPVAGSGVAQSGGGAGAYIKFTRQQLGDLSASPPTFTITVGAGGASVTSGNSGNPGGSTTWIDQPGSVSIACGGGGGGTKSALGYNGAGTTWGGGFALASATMFLTVGQPGAGGAPSYGAAQVDRALQGLAAPIDIDIAVSGSGDALTGTGKGGSTPLGSPGYGYGYGGSTNGQAGAAGVVIVHYWTLVFLP